MKIAIDKILANPQQPRKEFDDLDSLAASIKEHGLINAIAVEEAGDMYILIDGERRWRASKLAGLKDIEATVKPAMNGGGQKERLLLAMIANLQRADVNPIEEATGYQHMQTMGIQVGMIAKMVNKSPSNIFYYLNLLDFEPEIQELFARRKLPLSSQVVRQLLSLPDDMRVQLAQGFARRGSTISTILATCKRLSHKRGGGSREKIEGDFGPGMKLAYEHAKNHKRVGQWNVLAQSKVLPPWKLVQAVSLETCKNCAMSDMASEAICKECPLVDFIQRLMEGK